MSKTLTVRNNLRHERDETWTYCQPLSPDFYSSWMRERDHLS